MTRWTFFSRYWFRILEVNISKASSSSNNNNIIIMIIIYINACYFNLPAILTENDHRNHKHIEIHQPNYYLTNWQQIACSNYTQVTRSQDFELHSLKRDYRRKLRIHIWGRTRTRAATLTPSSSFGFVNIKSKTASMFAIFIAALHQWQNSWITKE